MQHQKLLPLNCKALSQLNNNWHIASQEIQNKEMPWIELYNAVPLQ